MHCNVGCSDWRGCSAALRFASVTGKIMVSMLTSSGLGVAGHSNVISRIAASPSEAAFISARFAYF